MVTPRKCFLILLLINLLNYTDRNLVSSVVGSIQFKNTSGFDTDLNYQQIGLLQTFFITSYVISSPVFGYLGDRYCRKAILLFGVFCWSLFTALSSFSKSYWQILLTRIFFGIGESAYTTVAPAILADLYVESERTMILAWFYLPISCGGAIGLALGRFVSSLFSWRWAFRITPLVSFGLIILGYYFIAEGEPRQRPQLRSIASLHSLISDVKYCFSVRSFVYITLGFSTVAFVSGAFNLWGPLFFSEINKELSFSKATYIFGLLTFVFGLLGTIFGAFFSRKISYKYANAESLVCATGLGVSVPCALLVLFLFKKYALLAWLSLSVLLFGLYLTMALVVSTTFGVVSSEKRSIASAVQIVVGHLLGDSLSSYIVGAISDSLQRSGRSRDLSLQYGLLINVFVCFAGCLCFALCAGHYISDNDRVLRGTDSAKPIYFSLDSKEESSDELESRCHKKVFFYKIRLY